MVQDVVLYFSTQHYVLCITSHGVALLPCACVLCVSQLTVCRLVVLRTLRGGAFACPLLRFLGQIGVSGLHGEQRIARGSGCVWLTVLPTRLVCCLGELAGERFAVLKHSI